MNNSDIIFTDFFTLNKYFMNLVCFSHLPWNFVYQRPQHILSRFTPIFKVFYIQEFIDDENADGYTIHQSREGVWIVIPHLQQHLQGDRTTRQRDVINKLFTTEEIVRYICWYYTPVSCRYSDHLQPALVIYDCMDELSAFKFADPLLKEAETHLFQKADLVFTGGKSLYEVKRTRHPNTYLFPSSIDKEHFGFARTKPNDLPDQQDIPHPRLGFFGVLDERFDIELIDQAAGLKPGWNFILIGPVVKIDPATLPRRPNIFYPGGKSYQELPIYLANWDIALIPFSINESTRFISPTKTPEYLAAGKPVISTPVIDVVDAYGDKGLVDIVKNAGELVDKATAILAWSDTYRANWLSRVDDCLANISWDNTWLQMCDLIKKELYKKQQLATAKKENYV